MSPTSNMTGATERLAALVAAKRQVLEILARLSRQQMTLIDTGEMAQLIKLLAGKQAVLSQLEAVERQLAPFRDQDPEQREWSSSAARADCQAQAEQCNALLAEVLQLEQQSDAAMRTRRDSAAAALAAAHGASDARLAYAAPSLAAGSELHLNG